MSIRKVAQFTGLNWERITNPSQEGFNNKIGWLTRQAYGYKDEEYLHLKIYDLPNLKTRKYL